MSVCVCVCNIYIMCIYNIHTYIRIEWTYIYNIHTYIRIEWIYNIHTYIRIEWT